MQIKKMALEYIDLLEESKNLVNNQGADMMDFVEKRNTSSGRQSYAETKRNG